MHVVKQWISFINFRTGFYIHLCVNCLQRNQFGFKYITTKKKRKKYIYFSCIKTNLHSADIFVATSIDQFFIMVIDALIKPRVCCMHKSWRRSIGSVCQLLFVALRVSFAFNPYSGYNFDMSNKYFSFLIFKLFKQKCI